MPRHQVSTTIVVINRDRVYIIYNIMLRELLTIVYIWRRWGFRHEWTSRCRRLWDSNLNCLSWALHHNTSSAFSPIHPTLSALMKRELSFDSGYESLSQRREGRKEEKWESFFKPRSHTYPLLYLLCWEAEPNTLTKTKTHFLLTLGLRVKNRNSYSPIIYAK